MALAAVCSKAVVDSLLIVTRIVGFYNCSMFCMRYFVSILVLQSSRGGRESGLLALFVFLVSRVVVWLFRTMPRVCLQFVVVVFPDHTHLLFFKIASSEDLV